MRLSQFIKEHELDKDAVVKFAKDNPKTFNSSSVNSNLDDAEIAALTKRFILGVTPPVEVPAEPEAIDTSSTEVLAELQAKLEAAEAKNAKLEKENLDAATQLGSVKADLAEATGEPVKDAPPEVPSDGCKPFHVSLESNPSRIVSAISEGDAERVYRRFFGILNASKTISASGVDEVKPGTDVLFRNIVGLISEHTIPEVE